MSDDPKQRSAVTAHYVLLGLCVLQVAWTFTLSSYDGLDRLVVGIFWVVLAVISCYLLFTAHGRRQIHKQAHVGTPSTARGNLLFWGMFVLLVGGVITLMFVTRVPFWAFVAAVIPVSLFANFAAKAIIRLDAKWLGEKSSSQRPHH